MLVSLELEVAGLFSVGLIQPQSYAAPMSLGLRTWTFSVILALLQWWGLSDCLDTGRFPAHTQEWWFYLLPSLSPQLQWFSTSILRMIEFAAFPRMP